MQDTDQTSATIAPLNFNAALIDCNAALDLVPGSVKALYRKAQALQGLGKPAEALTAASQALQKAHSVQAAGVAPLVTALAKQLGGQEANELD